MWTVPDPWSYSYVLGLYLGGRVGRTERSTRLMLSLDKRYPEIIENAAAAAQVAGPHCQIKVRPHPRDGCVIIDSYGPHWCDCERLGVRWTRSNHRNISVSHRQSVAILDAFIGPKC